ncbi:MAG: membrane protein insertion efficiency factor YidD [Clostridia bacterium]|nr:membrane protein insertion efficiency factor YidD [Clostridia bacterium]
MKYLCIWLVRFYQKFISPLKRPCCRFTPTCSQYALEAFEKRGFFVGFGLTVWRILRCNPFCAGGYDPVPEKKKKSSKDTQ